MDGASDKTNATDGRQAPEKYAVDFSKKVKFNFRIHPYSNNISQSTHL
ncbi:hypothetical protein [Acidovorax temperans]